jgi:tripartite-type tricarboxylate transporter receptor subunit TctC
VKSLIRHLPTFGLLSALSLALVSVSSAQAQEYPSIKPITMVIAYPPGGGADAIGRLVALKLAEGLGQSVVIDNRPGFSGNIGAAYAAKSSPDGYTLLLAPWTTYAINSVLYSSKVGYSLEKDFAPISVIGYQPMTLLVTPSLAAKTVPELIALAKSKPGALSYGSTGPGSLEHIAGEMFKRQTGTHMVHIPYRGNGPAITDLMAGEIQVLFATAPTWAANRVGGRLRALMVSSPERNSAFPELPTPKESGVPTFEARSTYGLLAPAGTPAPVVKRLNDEMAKVLQNPEVKEKFRTLGMDAVWSTPDELGRQIKTDLAKWTQVMAQEGIKAE